MRRQRALGFAAAHRFVVLRREGGRGLLALATILAALGLGLLGYSAFPGAPSWAGGPAGWSVLGGALVALLIGKRRQRRVIALPHKESAYRAGQHW